MKTKMNLQAIFIVLCLFPVLTFAQTYNLNATTNGQLINTCQATLFDEGGPTGNYANNSDYEITFASTNNSCIRAVIKSYEFEHEYDYLIFYDGPSSAAGTYLDSVTTFPQSTVDERGNAYYAQSGYITIRITSDGAVNKAGFEVSIDCPGQCLPPSTANTLPAGDSCNINTPICDLNGYRGNTSDAYSTDHEYIDFYNDGIFCGGINNNSWLSFMADSTDVVLDVWVRNCQGSANPGNPIEGIQLMIFDTDCSTFTPVSNCWSPAKQINGQITASGLTPGNNYLIMVDGYAEDICEYIFAASSGAVVADAGYDKYICEGESVDLTASGSSTVTWSASPEDPGLFGQENNETITVSPGETTTYTATVTGLNPDCPGTADVTVFVNSASASFSGLDEEYCEDDATPVTLNGNYATGSFSGNGVVGVQFTPADAGSGTHAITYAYDYSVITTFHDDFDPVPGTGWSHGASYGSDSWAVGTPQGGDGENTNTTSNPDPTTDHTSTNLDNQVYGQGLDYGQADGVGGYYDNSYEWLLSPEIDCSGLINTQLSFWRYANFEDTYDEAYVEISNDLSTWYDLPHPEYPQDDHWTQVIFDISDYADGETIHIRWTSISDGLQTYSGWNIDDVTVTGIVAGGSCTSTDVQYTTVKELPEVNAGTDMDICEGEEAALSGSVSGDINTGSWATDGSGDFTNPTDLNASYIPSQQDIDNGTVTLTLTSDNPAGPCGTTSDQVSINILPLDDPYFSYESGTFCATGPNVSPTEITTPGGTFSADPAGLDINSSTGEIDLGASTPEVTYTITYTTNGTCPSSSTFELTVTSGFDAEFYYNDPYCQTDDNPLPQHTTGSNGTYTASPAGLVFVNQNTGEIDLQNSDPGTYSITNTIPASGGCGEATHTENGITIYEAPVVNCSDDLETCFGESVTLNGTSGGSTTSVNWSTNGTGTLENANLLNAVYTPSEDDIDNSPIKFYLTSNDPSGPCDPASDSFWLYVYPLPQIDITTDSSYCNQPNGEITIYASGNNPFDYAWDHTTENQATADSLTPGQYSFTVTDVNGCSVESSATVFNVEPGSLFVTGINPLCYNDSTGILITETEGTIQPYEYIYSTGNTITSDENIDSLKNLPAGTYLVTIVDGNNCTMFSDSIVLEYPPELIINDTTYNENGQGNIEIEVNGGTEPYTYMWNTNDSTAALFNLDAGEFIVTITDAHNCMIAESYDIIFSELLIPNVITPNSDGLNDTWNIQGIAAYENVEISIFTRWGDDVFYFSGAGTEYTDQQTQWDGTRNGKDLPMGNYVYILVLNEKERYKGTVTIIR
ncbi:MAG: gliding motility-associated C-terminal domain-containing protein [Bacteroidales bacterium]